ncbi:hypothetical protein K505DRAFT_254363, partial [Melanomma pulvis-pyrius CBS 109.77]
SDQSGMHLRILPLGDSMTFGFQSTTDNGYRGNLSDALVGTGNLVDIIGS